MKTSLIILDWLKDQQSYEATEIDKEDFEHFVNVLSDAADYCIKQKTAEDAKWIRENIGEGAAVEFLKFIDQQ